MLMCSYHFVRHRVSGIYALYESSSNRASAVLESDAMSMITVYTTPSCVQCNATKRHLTGKGIPFETVDITQDPEAHAKVLALGYTAAPVVMLGDEHFAGFRPDKLTELGKLVAAA